MTHPRATSGVTLIEVNLAMGVLLFGIVSVGSLFPVGLRLAEQSFQASDSAAIAGLAKSQLELFSASSAFSYPDKKPKKGDKEGKVFENPPRGKPGAAFTSFECRKLRTDEKPDWTAGVWTDCHLLMTSGGEAGRIYPISGNEASRLNFSVNLAGSRFRVGDTFRIIDNLGGTACIPTDFIQKGATIPSITAIPITELAVQTGKEMLTLEMIRPAGTTAQKLRQDGMCRYSYAILLDGPDPATPTLLRAYVLIYKDHPGTTPSWESQRPVAYYPFFYRKPSLFQ